MTTFKLSRRLSVAIALASLALTLTLSSHHQQRQRMRRDILKVRQDYLQLVRSQSNSLKNQFTPGFKSQHIFRTGLVFSQGEIFKTQTPTNLAINGQGCFGVVRGGVTRYTRDGRFEWRDGVLSNGEGWNVLGYSGSSDRLGELKLSLDPTTRLYGGKYTSFHFDETGCLYGDSTMTDPVTGQVATVVSDPLFQVALFHLQRPETAESPTLLRATRATPGRAGDGALGSVCPGSLELANVDFMAQGAAWEYFAGCQRWWSAGLPASPLQNELRRHLDWDPNLRRTCFDNLRYGMEPGYRSTDILGWLCGEGTPTVSQEQGMLLDTHCGDDLALNGQGYFLLQDGRWSRALNLSKDVAMAERWVGEAFASELSPLVVPVGASNIEVSSDGVVRWVPMEGDGKPVTGYRLRLGRAAQVGRDGMLVRPKARPEFGPPGRGGFASVVQGSLELSNEDGYQRRVVGAALMEWAGLPLFPESPERRPSAPQVNPYSSTVPLNFSLNPLMSRPR